ncbi:MAG: type II toxin-antitoxin system VapC family toxin [Chloroflexi bacterium]|nr:type II toxin-antitoxin system VapC family toxin [Chloroflexota bacterium]
MLFLDTSALLKRYIDEADTPLVLESMDADRDWYASALAYAEAEVNLCRLGLVGTAGEPIHRRLADDWERFRVVPVDAACLFRAAEIGCTRGVRTAHAIHLAAADRLPRPLAFLTFDRRQAVAARALGVDVMGAAPGSG